MRGIKWIDEGIETITVCTGWDGVEGGRCSRNGGWCWSELLLWLGKLLRSPSKLLGSLSKLLLRSLSELLRSWSKLLLRLLGKLLLRWLGKLLLRWLGKLWLRGLSKLWLWGWLSDLWARSGLSDLWARSGLSDLWARCGLSDLWLWCGLSLLLTSREIVELSLGLLSWSWSLRSSIQSLRFTSAGRNPSPGHPTSGSSWSLWLSWSSSLEGSSSLACWSPS